MRLTHLNCDVLDYVLSLLAVRKDLPAALSTCRTLYDAGIRHLLREVTLVNNAHIEHFARLLLRKPHYGRWLRKLKLSNPLVAEEALWSGDILDTLANALAHASNTRSVDIDYAEPALCASPRLLGVLAQFSRLEALHLRQCQWDNEYEYDATLSLMERLRSPLRELTLATSLGPEEADEHGTPVPVTWGDRWFALRILVPFARTLETVYLHHADLRMPGPADTTFDKVRGLHVECCDIDMSVLERTFPRVDRLSISDALEGLVPNEARNKEHVCTVWRDMPRLRGNCLGLGGAVLLGCRAQSLTFVQPCDEPEDAGLVWATVENTQPRQLELAVRVDHPVDIVQDVVLVAPSLEMLTLFVFARDSPGDVYDYLMSLTPIVAELSQLQYLRVSVLEFAGDRSRTKRFTLLNKNAQQEYVEHVMHSTRSLGLVDVQWNAAGWDRTLYQALTYCGPASALNENELMELQRGLVDVVLENDIITLRTWFRADLLSPPTQWHINEYLQGRASKDVPMMWHPIPIPQDTPTSKVLAIGLHVLCGEGYLIVTKDRRWAIQRLDGSSCQYIEDVTASGLTEAVFRNES